TCNPLYIDFELDQEYEIGTVRIHLSNLCQDGVSAPLAVRAQTSEDGEMILGSYVAEPVPGEACVYRIKVDAKTSFLRLNFYPQITGLTASESGDPENAWLAELAEGENCGDTWVFLDEVEIFAPGEDDLPEDIPLFVSHIDPDIEPEGAGVIWTRADFGGSWSWHLAFEPVSGRKNVYRLVGISEGTGESGYALDVPENGFVYTLNCGNDWPALTAGLTGDGSSGIWYDDPEHLAMPKYDTEAVYATWNLLPSFELWEPYTFFGLDFDDLSVPTDTPDMDYWDPDYVCTAFVRKGDFGTKDDRTEDEIYIDRIRKKAGEQMGNPTSTNMWIEDQEEDAFVLVLELSSQFQFGTANEISVPVRFDSERVWLDIPNYQVEGLDEPDWLFDSEFETGYGRIHIINRGDESTELPLVEGFTLTVRIPGRLYDGYRLGGIWIRNGMPYVASNDADWIMGDGCYTIVERNEPGPEPEFRKMISCDQVLSNRGQDLASFGGNSPAWTDLGDISNKTQNTIRLHGWFASEAEVLRFGYKYDGDGEFTWLDAESGGGKANRPDAVAAAGLYYAYVTGFEVVVPVSIGYDHVVRMAAECTDGRILEDLWTVGYTNLTDWTEDFYRSHLEEEPGQENPGEPAFRVSFDPLCNGSTVHLTVLLNGFDSADRISEIRVPLLFDPERMYGDFALMFGEDSPTDRVSGLPGPDWTAEIATDENCLTFTLAGPDGECCTEDTEIRLELRFTFRDNFRQGGVWAPHSGVLGLDASKNEYPGQGGSVYLKRRSVVPGDLDESGRIDAKDYIMLKRFVLGTLKLTAQQKAAADANSDGGTDAKDYILVKRAAIGTAQMPSGGLEFEEREFYSTGEKYAALTGIGDCKDEVLRVPEMWNGLPVRTVEWWAFKGNKQIQKVELPDSVVEIDEDAFADSSIREISFGSGLQTVGEYAFSGCKNLEHVELPASLRFIGYFAFENCVSLKTVSFSGSVEWLCEAVFMNCVSLTDVVLPDAYELPYDFFYGCSSLKNVTFGSGYKTIGHYAFKGCSSLAEIQIPDTVTEIGGSAFEGCSALRQIGSCPAVT
ncbi:MAG: leucine-rich repeat protein, partial [Clostridia bacterium]|nr:leucine-rich repeat protein [Clostridia bacterium]